MALREKIALPPERAATLRERLAGTAKLGELAVLNTCNRIEFYGVASSPDDVSALEAAFCEVTGIALEDFAAVRARTEGSSAVLHLASVAAGLESQLLGENEIFGQVKDAYAAAQSEGRTGPVLNRVFQKVFQAAKHVRTHTAVSGGQVSVANVAVDIAVGIFGDLVSTKVLLVGAGEIGEKTAKAFQSRGAISLTVSSRTPERALALAQALDATALPFGHFAHHLADYDVVVSATSAPHAVVQATDVVAALARRRGAPMLLLDLALPRDIEPAAADREGVYLYNLDDLAKIAAQNLAVREAEAARARTVLAEKAQAIWTQVVVRSG